MTSAKKLKATKNKTFKFVCNRCLKYCRNRGKKYCPIASLRSFSVAQTRGSRKPLRKYLPYTFIQLSNSKPFLASPKSSLRIFQRKALSGWHHLINFKTIMTSVLPKVRRGKLIHHDSVKNMVINYLLKAFKSFLLSNSNYSFKSTTQDPDVSKATEHNDRHSIIVDTTKESFSSPVDTYDCPLIISSGPNVIESRDQEEIQIDERETQVPEPLSSDSKISASSQLQYSHFVLSDEQSNVDVRGACSSSSPIPVPPAELAPSSNSSSESHPGASVNIKTPHSQSATCNISIYQQLGIIVEKPKRPEFALRALRQETFGNWPEKHFLKSDVLAAAGFYYGGHTDSVRCFFCGGGLRDWKEGDDIWVEHARWFPKCAYLKQHVSQQFVNTVREMKSEEQITLNQVLTKMGVNKALATDNENRDIVRDPDIKSVTEMGYKEEYAVKVASQMKTPETPLSPSMLIDKLRQSFQENLAECSSETANVISCLQETNCRLRQQFRCKICMDKDVEVVFLPCGHLVSCSECASALKDCPVCRKFVKGTVRVFLC